MREQQWDMRLTPGFRDSYHKGTWILGVVAVAIGVGMTVVKPIPRKQLLAGGYMSQ